MNFTQTRFECTYNDWTLPWKPRHSRVGRAPNFVFDANLPLYTVWITLPFQFSAVWNDGRWGPPLLWHNEAILITHVPVEACCKADCLGLSHGVTRQWMKRSIMFLQPIKYCFVIYFPLCSRAVKTLTKHFSLQRLWAKFSDSVNQHTSVDTALLHKSHISFLALATH